MEFLTCFAYGFAFTMGIEVAIGLCHAIGAVMRGGKK